MSAAINNLINYSRSLPEPLDKLASKKVKVSSKYGSGTEATLSATVVKAVHAVCDCMTGSGEGAVGVIDHRMVAEYKSSSGPDAYHLVVYDSATGNIVASGYDKNTEMVESYRLHQTANDGAAVFTKDHEGALDAVQIDHFVSGLGCNGALDFHIHHGQRDAGIGLVGGGDDLILLYIAFQTAAEHPAHGNGVGTDLPQIGGSFKGALTGADVKALGI